jgi:hypothetical protein
LAAHLPTIAKRRDKYGSCKVAGSRYRPSSRLRDPPAKRKGRQCLRIPCNWPTSPAPLQFVAKQ